MDNLEDKLKNFSVDINNLPTQSPHRAIQDKFNASLAADMRNINETQRKKEMRVEERHQETLDELQEIKQNLSVKLDGVNGTLDIILNSLGHNMQLLQREHIHTNEQLAELNMLIAKKDQKGIKAFLEAHGFESVGLVLQLIAMLTGGN